MRFVLNSVKLKFVLRFQAISRNRENRHQFRHVRVSVRME